MPLHAVAEVTCKYWGRYSERVTRALAGVSTGTKWTRRGKEYLILTFC